MASQLTRQTRWIADAYRFVGLYSIPALTLVTVVSMMNVFTSGLFSSYGWIPSIWAFIFAATIDVNIVRLFLEAQIEKVRGNKRGSAIAFWVGLGLAIVTGAALLIEGLQQSIGLEWSNLYLRWAIGILIFFRVGFVVVLMAREGGKLGQIIAPMLAEIVREKEVIEEANEMGIPPLEMTPIEAHSPVKTSVLTVVNAPVKEPVKEQSKIEQWRSTGQKTATIDEVAEALNMGKRKLVNRLSDGTFKRSPRNQNLVLLSSVFQWLNTEQNEPISEPLPAVKPTNGNGNGHHLPNPDDLVILAKGLPNGFSY